jgi:hypothetical protein
MGAGSDIPAGSQPVACDSTTRAEAIYRRLNYKPLPFTKRKSVVQKSEFEKMDMPDLQLFIT